VEIYSIIFSKYDKSYTSEVREKVLGTMEKDSCAILVKELDLPLSPEELLAQQRQLQMEMLPKTKLMPGKINTFLPTYYKTHNMFIMHYKDVLNILAC
jgi:hypothetical protein